MNPSYRKIRVILSILLLLLICLYPNPTIAQDENVVSSIPSPCEDPHGLTWDGDYLWNADGHSDRIYKINPSTGEVVDSFGSPGPSPQGLTWDGDYLWHADEENDKIYELNPSTGAVVDSFTAPGSFERGLAWDGDYLWHTDHNDDKIYKIDPSTGTVVDSFSSPGSKPTGLAWDGNYLWNADSNDDKIYKLDVGIAPIVLFSVSASPSSRSVVRGKAVNFSISVDWTSGTPETVYLSISGVPDGCSAAFSPDSGIPDFTSTLTVATTEAATLGPHILTITGERSGGETHTTTVTLVIREYEPTTTEIIIDLLTNPTVLGGILGVIAAIIGLIKGVIPYIAKKRKKSD